VHVLTVTAGTLQIVMHTTLFFFVFLFVVIGVGFFRRTADDQETRTSAVEVDSGAVGPVDASRLAGLDGRPSRSDRRSRGDVRQPSTCIHSFRRC
jgi:hypothetical protein